MQIHSIKYMNVEYESFINYLLIFPDNKKDETMKEKCLIIDEVN